MANIDGLYTNQGNGVWGSNSQIIGITRVLSFSTTTPLGANAVYTSPTTDVSNYKLTYISGLTDQAGGFVQQYSDDGITWISGANTAVTASSLIASTPSPYRKYFRIVYTNGATAQTSFNFSCYLLPL